MKIKIENSSGNSWKFASIFVEVDGEMIAAREKETWVWSERTKTYQLVSLGEESFTFIPRITIH